MDKISKLKEMIVKLKMELIENRIPKGHCPYTYYTQITKKSVDCTDCVECRREFMDDMKKSVEKEIDDI